MRLREQTVVRSIYSIYNGRLLGNLHPAAFIFTSYRPPLDPHSPLRLQHQLSLTASQSTNHLPHVRAPTTCLMSEHQPPIQCYDTKNPLYITEAVICLKSQNQPPASCHSTNHLHPVRAPLTCPITHIHSSALFTTTIHHLHPSHPTTSPTP